MEASLKAANELYGELSAKSPDFKKAYESMVAFRGEVLPWWQLNEYAYDSFMVRAVAALIACDIHPVNNSGVLAYLKDPLGQDGPAIDAWVRHWTASGLASVERLVEPGPLPFGPRPMLADLCIVPQLYNARRFAVPLEAYPRLLAVEAVCSELPAFRDAAPGLQPDAPPEQRLPA